MIRLAGIEALEREVFGPVLHVATYRAEELGRVIGAINAKGYGLTFGIHSRIDDRVETAVTGLRVGNIYVNRNQIGAVVGVQPFGGEGLSGTGPKAGGPHYLARFLQPGRRPARRSHGAAGRSGAGAAPHRRAGRDRRAVPRGAAAARADRRVQPAVGIRPRRGAVPGPDRRAPPPNRRGWRPKTAPRR